MLPTPCAKSSRLVGVLRFSGSMRSVASTQSRVSRLATTAMVMAVTHTAWEPNALQSGKTSRLPTSLREPITWTCTRWSRESAQSGAKRLVRAWYAMPKTTATRGPWSILNSPPRLVRTRSQRIRIARATPLTSIAAGVKSSNMCPRAPRVVSPSTCSKDMSPSASESCPRAWGICLRMISTPMPESIPLMTELGKKYASTPARARPMPICSRPARTTAARNGSNPSCSMARSTITARPAAGPETPSGDPLRRPTTMPPTIPATRPENGGAPLARAMPRQSGTATKKTTMPAGRSWRRVERAFMELRRG